MADIAAADLVVNATPLGMGTEAMPVDADLLHAGQIVTDLVYHPLDTALLRAARAAGARAVDGLGMLVHQAAHSFRLWTGVEAPVTVMREAALAELATRAGRN
jgi:shikimate dehydrogenase